MEVVILALLIQYYPGPYSDAPWPPGPGAIMPVPQQPPYQQYDRRPNAPMHYPPGSCERCYEEFHNFGGRNMYPQYDRWGYPR